VSVYAFSGPETTIVSRPAATTFALPLTGEASTPTLRSAAAARTSSEAACEIVVESMRMRGAVSLRLSTPFGPIVTSLKSSDPPTIVNTTSRSARSAGESTTVAPADASASALLRVRLNTATSSPASSSRLARAAPMRPVPIHPIRVPLSLFMCSSSALQTFAPG
jgi:hypothetical protein